MTDDSNPRFLNPACPRCEIEIQRWYPHLANDIFCSRCGMKLVERPPPPPPEKKKVMIPDSEDFFNRMVTAITTAIKDAKKEEKKETKEPVEMGTDSSYRRHTLQVGPIICDYVAYGGYGKNTRYRVSAYADELMCGSERTLWKYDTNDSKIADEMWEILTDIAILPCNEKTKLKYVKEFDVKKYGDKVIRLME